MRRLLDCFLLVSICLSTLSARYDKRKYQDEDFDDRSMENNKFSSIMMEEARWGFLQHQHGIPVSHWNLI